MSNLLYTVDEPPVYSDQVCYFCVLFYWWSATECGTSIDRYTAQRNTGERPPNGDDMSILSGASLKGLIN